ncbi:hypothetical protein HY479_02535 [Candidatus Uhrbacteria bacterium]|nr:hypothetical protein [Candidatus Uhrbacteria bacterium]
MQWVEWKFSAQRAAQDTFSRVMVIGAAVILVAFSAFLLIRLVPEGRQAGVITLHYNVYLGIDDVRPWPWMFVLPASAFALLAADILFAVGVFRRDPLASRTLFATAFATAALWAVGIFFLVSVNT